MAESPKFNLVDLVARDYNATVASYRRLGVEVDDGPRGEIRHAHDTFWGARYAVLVDPDGNHVGLMSPSEDARKHWPPKPAPAADL